MSGGVSELVQPKVEAETTTATTMDFDHYEEFYGTPGSHHHHQVDHEGGHQQQQLYSEHQQQYYDSTYYGYEQQQQTTQVRKSERGHGNATRVSPF